MIKQDTLFLESHPIPNFQETMFGDSETNPESDPISDWLEDSIAYMPSFLDDPFGSNQIIDDRWWVVPQDLEQQVFSVAASSTVTSTNTTITAGTPDHVFLFPDQSKLLSTDISKKRKASSTVQVRKPVYKRGPGKTNKDGCCNNNNNNNDNKSGRWAEQLLNPCATAIARGNATRVRHLLVVLRELASPTGDANYRLAAHGLQALTHHLSITYPVKMAEAEQLVPPPTNFSTVKPKFFQQSLINFNEINPWFTIPNHMANNSILQVLSDHDRGRNLNLHILDIGVSHGVQWPTLLEALSSRPGGPPPLVKLTVVTPTNAEIVPFTNSPPGYNFISNILRSANDYKVNLHINTIDNIPLQNLNSQIIKSSQLDQETETLIVCAQFRLHSLTHKNPDHRTEFLKSLRSLDPKGVILNENNTDCSCSNCSTFETGFGTRVDWLWSFLDSASVAYKGRETEERKMMEGEASKALINMCDMNERKEKWVERMSEAGFAGEEFREDVTNGARALLRKYDSNWDLRIDESGKGVGLWWKGQAVSFCSLWKLVDES